jgi:hypothetical protein
LILRLSSSGLVSFSTARLLIDEFKFAIVARKEMPCIRNEDATSSPPTSMCLLGFIIFLPNSSIRSALDDIAGRYPVNLRKSSGGSDWRRVGWEDDSDPFPFWNVKISGCAVLTDITLSGGVCFGTRKHQGLRRISGIGGGEARIGQRSAWMEHRT